MRELEFRTSVPQIEFPHTRRGIWPVQYPATVRILDQGVQASYRRGVEKVHRARGCARRLRHPERSILIAEKFRYDIRARRIYARSTAVATDAAPVGVTPTTTAEKKNTDRTVSSGRRLIADMQRANLGSPDSKYCPTRVPALES